MNRTMKKLSKHVKISKGVKDHYKAKRGRLMAQVNGIDKLLGKPTKEKVK